MLNVKDGNGTIAIRDFLAGMSSKGIGPVSIEVCPVDNRESTLQVQAQCMR